MRRLILRISLAVLVMSALPTMQLMADYLARSSAGILPREPQLEPAGLGDGSLPGLQFADPAEQLVVMEPPEPNHRGGAQLEHPLVIPPGRAGFQPELTLTYDSAGGNGWVGTGWDLNVGEVSIDTRWGVPRYDEDYESETYMLDGAVLSPTAVRAELQDRIPDRSDFSRRVETEYELIIRHGDGPKTYWWEVRDKMGGVRWYGGYPDAGGPEVDEVATSYPSLDQDPSAILFDEQGNAYRWALTARRDVGVNMIRYFYEKVDGKRVGAEQATLGQQLYLRRILYTAASQKAGEPEDPAYEVLFLRDEDVTPPPTPRKDVIVDARGGFLEVTSDLLRRIEIRTGAPGNAAERTYDVLSRRYDLVYQEGAYAKTLLSQVRQMGSDGADYGTHTFDYYDDVRTPSGYDGFGPEVEVNAGQDALQGNALQPVPLSALGASETNAADVHAYIGFNTSNPTKNGSFGGAFTINGGATEALAEMMDINGDGLLDKVFRQNRNGTIYYRLNTTGPGRSPTYGEKREVGGQLNNLSTEFNIGLAVGFEANLAAIIQFTLAGDVTVGEQYFTDVNSDGLADFVSAGTVYFNRLDDNGNPFFETSSSLTSVPITTGSTTLPAIQEIQDLEEQRRGQSPLQDTLRRWVAPFSGTISIEAPVTLEPPIAPGNADYSGDGVRVAIQHNANQLWTTTLATAGGVTPVGLGPIDVQKGDRLYFRVQAIDDGARDQVRWNPTITYVGMPPADADGLSQKVYRGASDFTLAGRPNLVGLMPMTGTVRFEGTLFKTSATTDDVNVMVLKNGAPVFQQLISAATINPGGIPLTADFPVAEPTDTTSDMVEVRLAVDSPIDATAVRLDHRLYYIHANPVEDQYLFDPNGAPTMALQVPADTDIYPQNTLIAPREPWVSDRDGEVTAHASLNVGPNSGGGDVFFTVKSEAGPVAKERIPVPDSADPQSPAVDLKFQAAKGTRYWFDFSIRNPGLSDKASGQKVKIEGGETGMAEDLEVAKMSTAGRMAYLAATGRLDEAIAAARSEGLSPDISIAVDDTGQHIVVGANDVRGLELDPVSLSGYSYSDDGGETWMDGGTLPITTPTRRVEGSNLPMVFGSPQVKYLGGSTFVYFSIMVKDVSDTHAAVTVSFHRSTDYGHTWTGPYEVSAATNPHELLTDEGAPRDAADRPFIDVDPDTGRVMMSWINFTPLSPGLEISTTYTDTIMSEVPVWSNQVVVAATGVEQSTIVSRFAGGGSSEAYLAWQGDESGTSIRLALSPDNGASWSPATVVASELFFEQTSSSGWVQGFPSLAVDNSGWGGSQGNVYLVYVARSAGDKADIAFQRSTDRGLTFSSPVLLNSGPGGDRTQWVPWVTVDDDTGRVHVSYYDQSAAQVGDLTDAAHLFSDDGGVTWNKPAQVNDRSFHAVFERRTGDSGVSHQVVAQGGRLYAAWAGAPEQAPSGPEIFFKQVSDGRASLRLGDVSMADGNGEGSADGDGLLNLTLPLENYVTNSLHRASISGISATLESPTPGVSVLDGESAYPDLSPGASAANSTSYVLALGPEIAPGTPIELILTARGSEGSTTLTYTLTVSEPDATDTPLTEKAGEATVDPDPALASDSIAEAGPAEEDAAETVEVPSVLNWAGRQGAFPISYRGWGYVGYNGDGDRAAQPIHEADLELKADQLPDRIAEPQGFDDPDYQDVSQGNVFPFLPTRVTIRGASGEVIGVLPAWGGMKDSILGAADLVRTSRRGADSPSLGIPVGVPVQAIRRVGITAPSFTLSGGFGWATVGFGVSPSFGLVEYMDLNGDGFPDIVTPNNVKYTGPRGGFVEDRTGLAVVNQDTTFGVSAGIGADGIKFSANSRGDQGTAQDSSGSGSGRQPSNSSQTGGSGAMTETGAAVGGVSIGFTAAFTNPNASDPAWGDDLAKIPDQDENPTAPLELELADVNGDGLPDRVLGTPLGVYVHLNLGYRFAGQAILWASGAFEANESFGGSVGGTLGYSTPNREWAGGLGLSESIDLSHYAWIDVDGDGVLDRLRKDTAAAGSPVMVAFGTNSGVEPEVVYGPMAAGTFELASAQIPVGQQIAAGLNRGLGAGFDFTIGIGPLCFITGQCYLIINPGVHFDHSISTTQIQLTDIDGDGYPDSVKSLTDDKILVRYNNRGRTNLLSRVQNPLGGSIRLDYKRDGNTVSQPNSVWTLASVEVDDGRPGDGVDVGLSTYEYSGGRYDRLEREMLGYSAVVERQRAFAGDGDVSDDQVLRIVERRYLNNNVFDSGLQVLQLVKSPDGTRVQETRSEWDLIDLCLTGFPACSPGEADLAPTPTDPAGLRLLALAVAPQLARVEQRWFDANDDVGQETWTEYEYDRLGNVVRQVDLGELELPEDDLIVTLEYTTCSTASDLPCATMPLGGAPPYWHSDVCPTWTSLPTRVVATDGNGTVLRKRDGAPALCDNSAVTDLKEWFGPGADDYARTRLAFDAYGSYDTIWYPDPRGDQDDDPNDLHDRSIADESRRLRVDYTYDSNSHGHIVRTIDSHGLEAHATFDARTGRIDCRADENGQETRYTYDAFGRISTITGPYEPAPAGTGPCDPDGQPADTPPTVRFEYHTGAAGYAYAMARHFDVRHPADTIDTVTFVDGIGRQTQTKKDGTVFRGTGAPPEDVMLVSPAVDYDSLGRTVRTRYPVAEPLGTHGTYNTDNSGRATTFEWDLLDRETRSIAPGARTTTTTYDFGDLGPAKLFRTTVTDPENKPQSVFADVHNYVMSVDEGDPRIRTQYSYDPQGQLTQVTDNGGNVTTHSYDLMGRRISTQTPDGGLVETRWDPASNRVAMITPNLRDSGQQIDYRYDIDRLIAIDFPDMTPDVAYTYGAPGAPGNAAGRMTQVVDGARQQSFTYDRLGEVEAETTIMFLHNGPTVPFTTSFTRDVFGRLLTMTYPDGEVLTYQYDSGGLLSSLQGRRLWPTEQNIIVNDYLRRLEYDEFQHRRYQEFGNGAGTEYSYDPDTRWLARQLTETQQRTLQDLRYEYDAVGNVLTMNNALPAPEPNLYGGPSLQTYAYDQYHRLQSATGRAPESPGQQRDYTYEVTYDAAGNIRSKIQRDTTSQVTRTGEVRNPRERNETTYSFDPMTYDLDRAHQLAQAGGRSFSFDDNGNMTRIADSRDRTQRTILWDAANRAIEINDSSSSTDYSYDHLGLLGVQRDGLGETAFVNDFYETVNQGWAWRQIWAGGDRIAQATERISDTGDVVKFHYYQHENLQGSTQVVTDVLGKVFERIEYFPNGEQWISENSTTTRTPYRFIGALRDEYRSMYSLGQRWYEPREQVFYSPEPLLGDDPDSVISDSALLPAYTYAGSNPLAFYDSDGRASEGVQRFWAEFSAGRPPRQQELTRTQARLRRQAIALDLEESKRHSRLWQSLVKYAFSETAERRAAWSKKLEKKPLLTFELAYTGKKLGLSNLRTLRLSGIKVGFGTREGTVKSWDTQAESGGSGKGGIPGRTLRFWTGGSAASSERGDSAPSIGRQRVRKVVRQPSP